MNKLDKLKFALTKKEQYLHTLRNRKCRGPAAYYHRVEIDLTRLEIQELKDVILRSESA